MEDKEDGRDNELNQNEHSNVQLVGQGQHKKTNQNKTRRQKQSAATKGYEHKSHKLKKKKKKSEAINAESQSTGVTIGFAGNRATKRARIKVIVTAVVSCSRWTFQLERRPVPRFGGFLRFLNRPSLLFLCLLQRGSLPSPGLGFLGLTKS